ncbi:MAG: hypothetical protein R3B09_04995 [Nannocystaceae bacterium]
MNAPSLIAGVLGFVVAAVGVGALASWQSGQPLPDPGPDAWRPTCAQRLAAEYRTLDASIVDGPAESTHTVLFGVDRSPSNQTVADAQLAAVVGAIKGMPLDYGLGVLLISDRSDRSSTPDMPLEGAQAVGRVEAARPPCGDGEWSSCKPRSLFEQQCLERLEEALAGRSEAAADELREREAAARTARAERVDAWQREALAYTPKPGTSLLSFFAKVADLPPVLRSPGTTTLVVLSDLEEARTRDRKTLDDFYRRYEKSGACPEVEGIPRGLSGLDVVLLQTHTDGIDADAWGRRWEALLHCAGAHVRRQRYTAAISLEEYLRPSLAHLTAEPTTTRGS